MSQFLRNFGFLFLFTLTAVGCGPEETARDKQIEQANRYARKTRAQLLPAEGIYQGELTTISGEKWFAVLEIWVTSRVDTSNGGFPIEVPTLAGVLKSKKVDDSEKDFIELATYSEGLYSAEDGHVQLSGTFQNGSTAGKVSFDGKVSNGVLTARATQPKGYVKLILEKLIQ